MPERVDFWGIPHDLAPEIVVYSIMAVASFILLFRFYREASLWWRVGRPEARWDHFTLRLQRLARYAVVQTRVLSQRYPGVMHVAIAWGFFVFFLGTALATVDSHFVKFLRGDVYLIYKFVLDTFTVVFLFGAVLAGYRRFVRRPERLTLTPAFAWSLVLVVVIVAGGLIVESLRLAVERPAWAWSSPAGWLTAQIWIAAGLSDATLSRWHLGVWFFHLLSVATLFVVLPAGTLLHVLTGPLNVFFSKTDRPTGRLAPVPVDASGQWRYTSTLPDLTWKQLLDGDACTDCGRCQDACPAHAAGTPLSPKQLMVSLRTALRRDGPDLARASNGEAPALVGADISDEELWSCTTCGACVAECPVLIEHVDAIVDMRRYLVVEGRLDEKLQEALANLGRYGNSFGKSGRARAKWTKDLEPAVRDARKEAVDYLWFVGDYASYSAAPAGASRRTAEILAAAGVDFGILYDAESSAGNDVRRVGEEGLFEMLVENNAAALEKCEFKAIVTTDPHTYNALRNEYPDADGDSPPVLHYSELLESLIDDGRLKLAHGVGRTVTFHDPCYLGRYNGVYDPPRRVIEAAGCRVVEMPRHRERAFCCGAGGGRIWMDEGSVEERPSEARVREAAALEGVDAFVVACPKDLTMYQDAVKTTGLEGRLEVLDLADLVYAAMAPSAPAPRDPGSVPAPAADAIEAPSP